MAARPRTLQNRKLPPNLYPNGKYWRYRNPVTGVMTGIHRPREEAIMLARAANLRVAELVVGDGSLLAVRTGDRLPIVSNLLTRFEEEWLPDRSYAARTLEEIKFKLERYRQDLGDRLIGQLDVLAMAEYLDDFSNNAYTKHRGLWVQIFAFAVAKGLAERNNAELTLVKKEAEKKRQRHTFDGLRSEEHTSELQSQSTISYAVFCLKKKRIYPVPRQTNPSISFQDAAVIRR